MGVYVAGDCWGHDYGGNSRFWGYGFGGRSREWGTGYIGSGRGRGAPARGPAGGLRGSGTWQHMSADNAQQS